ncbi:hypothetical protein ABZ725_37590 [Streptomyces sp. NPDC006872]|uniref:hypothetical protein n=1 Tax=Streptomyces sp. NPDC006872 TaxID=3155720 RepID=UPI003406795C
MATRTGKEYLEHRADSRLIAHLRSLPLAGHGRAQLSRPAWDICKAQTFPERA